MVILLFLEIPFCPIIPDCRNRKAGADISMIFRQPGYLVEIL